jgi:hypothetical protein
LAGCKSTTIGTFNISNIELLHGGTANSELIQCSTLEGSDLWTHQHGYPKQPKNGDWSENGSPYKGELLRTGDHAYQCAIARVTVTRNANVTLGTNCFRQL